MSGVEIKRAMTGHDIAMVTTLLDLASENSGRPSLSDHLRLDLESGGGRGFVGLIVRSPGTDLPHAYGQVSGGNDSSSFEMVLDPERRDEMATIGAELVAGAVDFLASQGGGRLSWFVTEPTGVERSLASAAGMRVDRTLLQMRRRLPVDLDVTVQTRAFLVGSDEGAWLDVNNRAFADHEEQGGWTLDTLDQRERETWFDAEGFRIHDRENRMAAFCWTKVHPPSTKQDHELGEIYVIAVDPDFHGLGLGTQLTLAGLEHLAQRGISTALLYVDAASSTAVGMYERLGFETYTTTVAFTLQVPPSSEAAKQ
jgi:mycothiol synthase